MRHKDRIPDLLEWKRSPDHFYFVKFFDPYIKREFEVIRTASVNNGGLFRTKRWFILCARLNVSASSRRRERGTIASLRIPDHGARDGGGFDRQLSNLLSL